MVRTRDIQEDFLSNRLRSFGQEYLQWKSMQEEDPEDQKQEVSYRQIEVVCLIFGKTEVAC